MGDGHDKDYLSIISKAYLYSRKHAEFNPTRYPYCGMIPWHQKQFKECLDEFQREDEEILTDEIKNLQFYDWQRKAELALLSQHNKQIVWIYMYDQEGGKGKSTLDEYLNEDIMLLFSSTDRQQI